MNRHLPTFDGLRGVAAIAVLLLHCLGETGSYEALPHGALAVDFFFMLSGFVIARSYEHKLGADFTTSTFLKVRFIRLYPMIGLGMVLGAAVFLAKYAISHDSNLPLLQLVENLTLGLTILPSPLPPNDGWDTIYPLDGAAWSLFFEILANVLFVLFTKRLGNRLLIALTAVSAAIVFAQAYLLGGVTGGMYWGMNQELGIHQPPIFLPFGVGRVAFPFLAGMLLYRYDHLITKRPPSGTGFLAAGILVADFIFSSPSPNWLYESLIVTLDFPAIMVLARITNPGKRLAHIYLWLGQISYPLYLVHAPIVHLFGHYERVHNLQGMSLAIVLTIEMLTCLAVAQAAYMYVDVPVRVRLSRRILAKHPVIPIPIS